jgi:hypothetical protein
LSAAKKTTEDLGIRVKEAIEKGLFEDADRLQKELQSALFNYFKIQETALKLLSIE